MLKHVALNLVRKNDLERKVSGENNEDNLCFPLIDEPLQALIMFKQIQKLQLDPNPNVYSDREQR
jgi:hypothetical protein